MARRTSRKVHGCLRHSFQGKKSFIEFFRLQCTITRSPRDVVKRVDLFRAYKKFCIARCLPIASMVNIGRHLGGQHVWASKRLGGANGRNQEYAYVGLFLKDEPDEEVKEEQPSPPVSPATPRSTEVTKHTPDWVSPLVSPNLKPLMISLPHSTEDALGLFDSFMLDHVECTGSAEDAVSIEELHKAYRRLCRSKGITPPSFSKLKSRCLSQRENVAISRVPFQSVKRAYTGLRWTRSAMQLLNPSRRVEATPSNSSQANSQPPTAPVVMCDINPEGNEWIQLLRVDGTEEQTNLGYWGEDSTHSGVFFNSLVSSPSLLPTPAPLSPPTPPETQDSDLFQMLDIFATPDPCMF